MSVPPVEQQPKTTAGVPVTTSPPRAVGVAWDEAEPGHGLLPVDRFFSPVIAEQEAERMWPHVWQIACSVDHVRHPGDYYEYRCGPLSVLIVRGDDGCLRAFQNVCRHRGNLICQGAGGGLTELRCGFHNWTWTLSGELSQVPRRRGFGSLRNEDLPLLPAQIDTWGPLVFVNLDLDAGFLSDWLEGVPDDIEWADIDQFGCGVTTTTPVSCNWKVTSEGFSESYHVQGLHPEMIASIDDAHAAQYVWDRHAVSYQLYGVPSPGLGDVGDEEVWHSFCSTQGRRLGLAVDQTVPLPPLAVGERAFDALCAAIRHNAAQRGVDLGLFDDDQIMRLRQYNLFPNATVLVSADSFNVLVARPGDRPGRAELHTMHFDRRPTTQSVTSSPRPAEVVNPLDAERLGLVFNQDVRAMAAIQRGMGQPGFTHAIVGSEERRILNTHRVMSTYLSP